VTDSGRTAPSLCSDLICGRHREPRDAEDLNSWAASPKGRGLIHGQLDASGKIDPSYPNATLVGDPGVTSPVEREWKKGQLAKDVSYRLIVTGNVGVKEIEQLIKHLELEKEMLANQE
jgi:hypothetical protein